jgi:uncharacterized protein (DUF58 family)
LKRATFWISFLSYIWLFAITVFCAVFYLQTFFFLLVILEICLPFFSYFLTRYCFYHLTPVLQAKPNSTVKGESSLLIVSLDNQTWIPISSATVRLSFHSLFYQDTTTLSHVLSLRAHHDNPLQFPVKLTKCGLYEASISRVECYDFLHLFHFKRDLTILSQIQVFPSTQQPETERHESLYSEGFDEFEESGKSGNVSSNVTDIREYQPGDRLQKIHWKLSSKIDKLMVKENEATSTNEFLLLMELFQPQRENCIEDSHLLNALDHTLEEAWAIALELLQAGEIFVFAVYSSAKEDFVMSTIRSVYDLETMFSEIYYEPAYATENLALDIYEKSSIRKGTVLHVTHKGVIDVPT